MSIWRMILAFLRAFFASRAALAVENVLLRQQLIVLQRSVPRLKLQVRNLHRSDLPEASPALRRLHSRRQAAVHPLLPRRRLPQLP